ncbi:MAG: response regulator [Steroidobacteraceae bacterium]
MSHALHLRGNPESQAGRGGQGMARNKIRVLIVDDSPVDRELLIAMIGGEPDFEVAGQAADAYEAREKIRTLNPDVLTLDVEMPRMDGIKFLRNLMRLHPCRS